MTKETKTAAVSVLDTENDQLAMMAEMEKKRATPKAVPPRAKVVEEKRPFQVHEHLTVRPFAEHEGFNELAKQIAKQPTGSRTIK